MARGKQPITRHPLFPATVALWFGTLFGIGSLAVHPALIESAIVALKLDAIIAVPMGPTTRILIALALAGAGGLLGAKLARRIGRPKQVVQPRKRGARFPAESTESPAGFSASEATASPEVRTGRRTQLAIPDNAHGGVEYYDRAPVPGETSILDVSQFGIDGFEPEKDPVANRSSVRAAAAVDENSQDAAFLPGPAYIEPPVMAASLDAPEISAEAIVNDRIANPLLPRLGGEEAGHSIAKAAGITRPLFDRARASGLFTQPLSAKVSEIRWQDDIAPVAEQPASEPEPDFDADADAVPKGDASAANRIVSARLDELAPIELLERLAISLHQKRSRAALAEGAPPEPAIDETSDLNIEDAAKELEAEETASMPTPAAAAAPPVSTIPAALRPIGLDPEDDEDALPGYIPPRQIGGARHTYSAPVTPSPTDETSEANPADPASLDGGYSSLLNLSRPAWQDQDSGQRSVRIDEPEPFTDEVEPAVVFPNQPATSPGDPAPATDGFARQRRR